MSLPVRNRRRCGATSALGLIFAVVAVAGQAGADDAPLWTGSGSCAATACHGGRREPLGMKGSEYAFSEAYDPHARAFSVLYDDRSKLIEKNYRRLADLDAAMPTEDDACLRCHVHQGYDSKAPWTHSVDFTKADGAGCEGCHGAAGKWLIPHVEYGWRGLSDRQKLEQFGMRPTKDLAARARACLECHVGEGSTDVNHDLIAAGHPRLNFEYGNQLAKLPKHWRIEDDRARNPDLEAKTFVLGQLMVAQSSLALLAARAARSIPEDSTAPWPEFAEYSCFSCHHDLAKPGWSSANVAGLGKPGGLQWGTWTLPLGRNLPSRLGPLDANDPGSPFAPLKAEMARPEPDPRLVADRASRAAGELTRLVESVNQGRIAPDEVRSMLASFKGEGTAPGSKLDWDLAARQYLAIVALDRAANEVDPRYDPRPARAALQGLHDDLNLPRRVDGGRLTLDSPRRIDLDRIRLELNSVQAALPNR